MYWSIKSNKYLKSFAALTISGAAFLLLTNCSNTTTSNSKIDHEQVFDFKGYFSAEIQRLKTQKPMINKTVHKDSITENKKIYITDWDSELSSFANIDLNKPVYQGYLKKDSAANLVTYTITNPDLDLTYVRIKYVNNKANSFEIERSNKNLLYNTLEHLKYSKDSLYSIQKTQIVKGLGQNIYLIEGLFVK